MLTYSSDIDLSHRLKLTRITHLIA